MSRFSSKYIPLMATAVVMLALYAAGCVLYRNFFSLRVAVNLFGDNAFLGIAAIGATLVILSGGIDLSVGSVVAFSSILIATLVGKGVDPIATIVVTLLAGAFFGAGMGCLIQWFELPPFLVTLAGMFLARGVGFIIYPQSLGIKHPFFLRFINETLSLPLNERVSWPFTATCYLVIFLAAIIVAHYTKFGRYVYAVGGDEHSAKLMGLPVGRTKVFLYTVSGFCSALAGVVYTFYTQSGNPASCVGLELDAISAVVIGGTLLSGGAGFMAGTLMGVLILGLIRTLITFQGNVNSWWTSIVVAVLVLLFILLQKAISLISGKLGTAAVPGSTS
jgi:Ribose/xylose/arabinose/galactoside ABC-type transport systems, permease components